MKGLIGMVTIFVTILLLTGCCGCSDEEFYKQQFKFKPGEFVTHKVSEDKVLITDTIRTFSDCGCDEVTLYYEGVNSAENDNSYDEIELKK